eukprot:4561-Amphidinium_carterae.1
MGNAMSELLTPHSLTPAVCESWVHPVSATSIRLPSDTYSYRLAAQRLVRANPARHQHYPYVSYFDVVLHGSRSQII